MKWRAIGAWPYFGALAKAGHLKVCGFKDPHDPGRGGEGEIGVDSVESRIQAGPKPLLPSRIARSVLVYPHTLATSSSLAWSFVP
jgi:hypothetical protein